MSKDDYADLPAKLREEAFEADRLAAELAAGKTPGTPGNAPAPNGEAPTDPQDNETDVEEHGAKPGDPTAQAANDESYRQKYEVLRGKYDAEVPRLNAKLRDLHIQNTDLQNRVTEMESALARRSAGGGQGDDSDGVNPGDYEDYGEEFVRMAKENNRLKAMIEELRGDVAAVKETSKTDAQSKFYAALDGLKPDWGSIDSDPAFDNWLYEAGHKDAYLAAAQKKNAAAIVDIMDLFLMRTGRSGNNAAPQSNGAKPQANGQKRINNLPDLESQVQPTSTGSNKSQGNGQGRVYTKAFVNEFYNAYAKGQFPFQVEDVVIYGDDDGARIDTDITRANMEGRIVG